MKEKKSIQVIRGICALLVIFIHSMYLTNTNYDYLNIFFRSITNFSVAAFIFLSGYLTKEEKVSLFYKKKLKRIFVPLLLWDIIYTGISVIFNGIGNSTEILKSFLLSEHSVHLYYLYVLLQLFFLTPLLYKFIKNKKNSGILFFLPLLITPLFYLISDILKIFYNYNIPFYNYYFVNWFSYYYLGMIIKETKLHWQKGKTNKLIVISLLLSIIYRMFIYNKFGYYDYAVTQITLLNFFFSIFMCLLMFSKIDNLKIKNNILLNFGNYSFGIYLSHVLFAMVFKKIVLYFNLPYLLNILIIFTLTCMVTYICNMIYYEKIKGRIIWKK